MESVAATDASLPSDSVRREFVHLAHGRICVVGNRVFQNGLLVHFLRQSTGLPCESLDSVRHIRLREKEDSMQQRQILWDFLGQDPEKILVGRMHLLQAVEPQLHQQLRLRPRYEDVRVHRKCERPEFLHPGDVLDGLSSQAFPDEFSIACDFFFIQWLVKAEVELDAVDSELMGEEDFRGEAGAFDLLL